MTRLVALLGDPVGHSLSPAMQGAAFRAAGVDGVYLPLRTAERDLAGLLLGIARAGGAGNVTLPHKERAHDLVERRTAEADRTGAVNTFWFADGEVHGDNTDVEGFRLALRDLLPGGVRDGHVLLLGAGGAARAVLVALEAEGVARVELRNRTPARALALASRFGGGAMSVAVWERGSTDPGEAVLVVNATRLGLEAGDPFPLEPREVPAGAAILDLVYGPDETRWVRALRAAGHAAADGGTMLIGQGAAAYRRWWGTEPPMDAFRQALGAMRGRPGGGEGE
jgi:shikimate dehydrogenase